MNLENERLPRTPRKLTYFMAQAALYDYISGRLGAAHKAEIEVALRDSAELRNELNIILEAEKYTSQLAKTRIAPMILDQMQSAKFSAQIWLYKLKLKNWPDTIRWSVEAFLISVFIAIGVVIAPWDKIQLPKISKSEVKVKADVSPVTKAEVSPVIVEAPKKIIAAKDTGTPDLMVDEGATVTAAPTVKGAPQLAQKMKGLLYRILIDAKNIDAQNSDVFTNEIPEKIISMGGKKAGQVPLGWRKKDPDGNYYHFSMPESNYQQLITTLGGYGLVRIFKNPHERVMPEGQIRIILWIEDKVTNKTDP